MGLQTCTVLRIYQLTPPFCAPPPPKVALHADGRSRAITGTIEGIVKLWTLDGRGRPVSCTRFADHGAMVVCARVQLRPHQSPAGTAQLGATGSNDRTIRVYSLLAKTTLLECRGHTDCIGSLVFVSATGLASGADDKTIKLWELGCPKKSILDRPAVPVAAHGHVTHVTPVAEHRVPHVAPAATLIGHPEWVLAVRFQPKMPRRGRCTPHPHQAVDRLVTVRQLRHYFGTILMYFSARGMFRMCSTSVSILVKC